MNICDFLVYFILILALIYDVLLIKYLKKKIKTVVETPLTEDNLPTPQETLSSKQLKFFNRLILSVFPLFVALVIQIICWIFSSGNISLEVFLQEANLYFLLPLIIVLIVGPVLSIYLAFYFRKLTFKFGHFADAEDKDLKALIFRMNLVFAMGFVFMSLLLITIPVWHLFSVLNLI